MKQSPADRLRELRGQWDQIGVEPEQPPAAPAHEMDDAMPADALTPDSEAKVTLDVLKDRIMVTLNNTMKNATKDTERVAAANAAIKYIAVINKVGPEFGGAFGDDEA